MIYLAFEKSFSKFPVFSFTDINKRYPGFDRRRLVEWQQKGYIQKIRKGYYCLKERKKDELFLFFAANKTYSPSYVSLESALAYYSFIPEGVFTTSSITTKNTASFETPIGDFLYSHVKPELFFGYKLIKNEMVSIKIAEPEKVILDYLYFKKLNSLEDIKGMRFNSIHVYETIDFQKLEKYQNIFNSSVLNKRIKLFKKVINA